jgi:hypothetical protein
VRPLQQDSGGRTATPSAEGGHAATLLLFIYFYFSISKKPSSTHEKKECVSLKTQNTFQKV